MFIRKLPVQLKLLATNYLFFNFVYFLPSHSYCLCQYSKSESRSVCHDLKALLNKSEKGHPLQSSCGKMEKNYWLQRFISAFGLAVKILSFDNFSSGKRFMMT